MTVGLTVGPGLTIKPVFQGNWKTPNVHTDATYEGR